MSAAFRLPPAHRLQRLLPTRTPLSSSSSPSPRASRHLALPRQTTTSFSTSRAVRNTNTNTSGSSGNPRNNANGSVNASGNPAYPKFDLRSIVPNPRARKALIAVFCVMVVAESYMWITYWPRIMGWWGGEGKGEGSQ
ncbi:uncharacterized protein B0H64DRAFT_477741 [Chaetomium fimeti]|uniref:Uncharacterized protein n=1 Tax=Chaetomium fimeti TaxID=1854472 RepID=A0AAE0LPL7_9PEZI|nr:hypothetical protein B0H64DRAFT_477741 [Chaetomium fimeti]